MVREIAHGVVIEPELPKERTYSALVPLPVEPIVGGNDQTGPIDINIPNVTVGTAQDIRGWKTIFWFYGNVAYDDTFGWRRTLYFEFYYDGSSRGLRWWDCRETEKKHQT
jgi:hypothetical protein